MGVKTYVLEVDEELWERFKMTVPKTKKINDILIEMIEERVKAFEEKGLI
jgi:hypothetical protein